MEQIGYRILIKKGEIHEKHFELLISFFTWLGRSCMELFRFDLSEKLKIFNYPYLV